MRNGIGVTVGSDINVNFSMQVGAVSEKVEVTAEAAQVDTSSATLGGVVSSNTIRELPLNGRDFAQLALLEPGVAPSRRSSDSGGPGTKLVINGNRPGHEIEYPLAVVILGGLCSSTILNLFVLPPLYARFGRDSAS